MGNTGWVGCRQRFSRRSWRATSGRTVVAAFSRRTTKREAGYLLSKQEAAILPNLVRSHAAQRIVARQPVAIVPSSPCSLPCSPSESGARHRQLESSMKK